MAEPFPKRFLTGAIKFLNDSKMRSLGLSYFSLLPIF